MSKGKIVGISELAELMGVTVPTVRNYVKKGMPVFEAGGKGPGMGATYCTGDAWKWAFGSTDNELKKEKLAKLKAERKGKEHDAVLKQMEVGRQDGKLIDPAEMRHALASAILTSRSRLLMLPDALCLIMADSRDEVYCHDILEKRIRESLSNLEQLGIVKEGEAEHQEALRNCLIALADAGGNIADSPDLKTLSRLLEQREYL